MLLAIDLAPNSLESILIDLAVIAGLVASIVVGVMALRRRR